MNDSIKMNYNVIKEDGKNVFQLIYIGHDSWDRPVYEVNGSGKYVKDILSGNRYPSLHTCCPEGDPEGEPDYPFNFDDCILRVVGPPMIAEKTRDEKKAIIIKMIAANEFKPGKNSIEWLDLASSINNLSLTMELTLEIVFESIRDLIALDELKNKISDQRMIAIYDNMSGWIVKKNVI